jgi:ankyrin repeat protein
VNGHEGVVRLLLARGADVDARIFGTSNSPHLAASKGREAVVKVLMDFRPDTQARTSYGDTAMDIAETAGYFKIVKLLKKAQDAVEPSTNKTSFSPATTLCSMLTTLFSKPADI